MPNGAISTSELITLEELAHRLNRTREWAYDTFIRPIDAKTKKRLIDQRTGAAVVGVKCFRKGSTYLIRGANLDAWLAENAEAVED